MYHFNEGDKSSFLPDNLEVAVTGDFGPIETVVVREAGGTVPILGFQAVYLATGEYR